MKELSELQNLKVLVDDDAFLEKILEVKLSNKTSVAAYIKEHYGVEVLPESLFDIQVKRIHEYKRQLMNLLYVVTLYNRIKKNPGAKHVPRTVIIGGKVRILLVKKTFIEVLYPNNMIQITMHCTNRVLREY